MLGSNSSSALGTTAQLRARLPDVAPAGAGLVLLGISAYAFLGLAGHALAPREYAAVASLYLLIAVVGAGAVGGAGLGRHRRYCGCYWGVIMARTVHASLTRR